MKTFIKVFLCLALSVAGARAQTGNNSAAQAGVSATVPPPTPYRVVDRGLNHRLWQRETYEPGPNGQVATHVHQYTELASGMCYQKNGQWVDSQDLIESYSAGAIAQNGQYQVIFANNLNSAGAIDQQTPDNKRLRSNILGLAYYDTSTGNNVLIAQIQDSQGELISSNQVLYTNAFAGLNADVRYTYKKGRFEQDVILREQPPTPESFGLNAETTEIEVLTEFLNPPDATVVERRVPSGSLPDERIGWGAMCLGDGRAFDLGGSSKPVHARKQYVNTQGRYILIEGVPWPQIKARLSSLPLQSSAESHLPVFAAKARLLPKTPLAQIVVKQKPMGFASAGSSQAGYVLDYVELNSETGNFTFQGDTTYFVDGNFGTAYSTTFEGGTVVKFNSAGSIITGNAINCPTASYRPAIITSMNDDTVGEQISGSSGSPSAYDYGSGGAIEPYANAVFNNMRFSYSLNPITAPYSDVDVWDSQFSQVDQAITSNGANVGLHNVLIQDVVGDPPIEMSYGNFLAEQVTCDSSNCTFAEGESTGALTNCISTAGGYVSIDGGTPRASAVPIFQTVGAGSYYLTNNSPYRNAGTTNIDPAILADIASKTTYPPIVYDSVTFSAATNFGPQAQRDYVGNPDLGYHYDPLDYAFGNSVAESNITFSAGTAVAWYYDSSGASYGLTIGDSAAVSFNGTATAPCYLARYSMVQEGGNGNWTPSSYVGGFSGQSYTHAPPTMTAQFTKFTTPANEAGPYANVYYNSDVFVFNGDNCEFYGAGGGGYYTSINVTNCLFVNGAPGIWENQGLANITMQGCTCFRGNLLAANNGDGTWPITIFNCAFDSTTFSMSAGGGPTNGYYTDYNSFLVNSNRTLYDGPHDLTITNGYNWQTSWFGNYYLPTNSPLIQTGNTNANLLGLYHFTTQTNQVPETNAIVDIGYHYVATDTNGVPLDTNGDGIPDYLEDANGNGLVDSGEIGWNIPGDLGLQVIISKPRNGTTLP